MTQSELSHRNNKKVLSFTLIEMLFYLTIIVIILTSGILITNQIIETKDRARAETELFQNVNFVINKLRWVIQETQSVNSPALNTTSTGLSINKINSGENPHIFSWSNEGITLSVASQTPQKITSDRVIITNLEFKYILLEQKPTIKINLSAESESTELTSVKYSTEKEFIIRSKN